MQNKQPLANVLLVDDSHYDVVLTKILLEKDNVLLNLIAVGDGREAIAYLDRLPPFEDVAIPDLMLLDLNMPDMNGFQVLTEMTERGLMSSIPVVVCSGSDSEQDIATATAFGVVDYVIKPLDYSKLASIVEKISNLEIIDADSNHVIQRRIK